VVIAERGMDLLAR